MGIKLGPITSTKKRILRKFKIKYGEKYVAL